MGRNKLETEFSQKLSAREINPSIAAWDRLDAMLTTAETKKKPRRNYYLFVAAAIVGIAMFSGLFLLNGSDVKTVDTKSSTVAETELIPAEIQSDSIETPAVQMAEVAPSETSIPASTNKPIQLQPRHQKQMLAVNEISVDASEPNQQETSSVPKKPTNLSNTDIPKSLLSAIKSKTEAQKISVVKVDARSLLQDVDKEPELTKGQRFLRIVGKNYQSVKVAVESRNLEESH